MTARLEGPLTWGMARDTEGHREYKITFLVITDDPEDGPGIALRCPGLPIPGSWWIIGNEVDLWAWCRANAEVEQVVDNEPNYHWKVTQTFSTKPPDDKKQRCQDNEIEDPLLEPQRVSGTFIKYTEEATIDRFGQPIMSSSHEQLKGPAVEFDANRLQVRIEQNVADLELDVLAGMVDTVNNAPIWGLPRRCVKLSAAPWEKKFYGTCYVYYTRTLEFDTNFNTFDRDILDEGTKVLEGHWEGGGDEDRIYVTHNIDGAPANPLNPKHFVRAQDPFGNLIRVALNGAGLQAGVISKLGGYFLSLSSSNTGNPLEDIDFWIPYSIDMEPEEWSFATPYPRGSLVTYNGNYYITLATNLPAGNIPVAGPDWAILPDLPFDAGTYDDTETYGLGNYVQDGGSENTSAYRHVEKYNEANFLLLGIPTIL